MPAPLWHTKVFFFINSDRRDFSERDRAVLDLLRPHLARFYRLAQTRRSLGHALSLLENTNAAVVWLEGADRIVFSTKAAQD